MINFVLHLTIQAHKPTDLAAIKLKENAALQKVESIE